jgi:Zn-dependent membrane protease YugP
MGSYFWFLGAILVCGIVSAIASGNVHKTYAKYGKIRTMYGVTGYEAATRLLRAGDVNDVRVGKVSGNLTDHYHPAQAVVNLSESTYDSPSIAAAAVAAHEVGHVMQNKRGYLFYRVRTALVPVVNIGSRLAMPLVLIGLLLDGGILLTGNSDLGYGLAMFGVLLYASSFLFTVITLPVEWDASRRAKQMLLEEGILSEEELPGAERVLSAAAMTYAASLLVSILYMVRFLFLVLSAFGRRSQRR